ncbi:MAG: hypothetical protein IKL05_06615 [Clostridia bacterium]|nr:hypothetical protein [Clostridia bacterium]
MKGLLEDIWFNYYIEKTNDNSFERKELLRLLTEKQKEVYEALNDKQMKKIEEAEAISGQLNCVTEKDAFTEGVRFGVQFVLEAMKG